MKTYRVAILGCRSRGTAAARAYHAHPRTVVVGLCDLIPERADTLGEELGVTARYTDLDAMLAETVPDIVAIPTGTEFHYELCLRVLDYGVHIDVEKPLCVDLLQADRIMAKAAEKGVRLAVHHQGRVGAAMRASWQAFTTGRIGSLRYIWGSGKGYYGGYGLLNIGTHLLTNFIKFGGPCQSVTAVALTDGQPIDPQDVACAPGGMGTLAGEHITATLQFPGQVTATLLQHRFPKVDSRAYRMVLFGTEGRIMWKTSGAWWLPDPHYVPKEAGNPWESLPLVYPDHFNPTGPVNEGDYSFVEEFVQALDQDRDHDCSGEAARHVVEIMMGIFAAAAYRQTVPLPQTERDHPLLHWRREQGLAEPPPAPRPYGAWLAAEDRRLGRREK